MSSSVLTCIVNLSSLVCLQCHSLILISLIVINHYYNHYESPVYTCFLDASKAFDRMNHWTLFSKVIARGVPCPLVRIIVYWDKTLKYCVKWGILSPSYFGVSNGVRQGGIHSPKLFSDYVRKLSRALSAAKTGCLINDISVNHACYAADLCIMSASPSGLQRHIDSCVKYCLSNSLT